MKGEGGAVIGADVEARFYRIGGAAGRQRGTGGGGGAP
jgi:hypothetical protein